MTVKENAAQVDDFLNQILLLAENQREILLGFEHKQTITLTQGHLLMILAQKGPQTNGELAQALAVSPAAVTKAMKILQNEQNAMVTLMPDPEDGRINRWALTDTGRAKATEHADEHQTTQSEYIAVLNQFTDDEQAVVSRFITAMTDKLTGGNDA
ncbi:MarR family transcriptional regulator [Weissella viridescens]|jgi:DNA-binding MarR family transcriptional regulator|uniref:Multiple antibiotic resistance operon transcriptional repressor MarR n=1 Tax=Weissella viridescens TaxID=1629 RepID=A0A0R2H1P1_WEIVI|nr:MarR family transcriptional regulator [Weissella viridescens]KRN46350.1 multiple antibiotic resistance operon transcriptional repressor MarR [Weissella viridescens]MCB6840749.1 MarR family transcriptional regulator [Weissella viridescens]MCB6847482.1 MarR family transcriptional regulator [Weissella viridescens]QOD86125.1 MarR family transcriptional regulator [Weissella viridescens]WJI91253.1 MarR family transcriptional regulator [Weissella viridescens]